MLLDGINHIAWISKDVVRLGRFYAEVFDADVGPTRAHGQDGNETMTVIRIGVSGVRRSIHSSDTPSRRRIPYNRRRG